jgi:hypothetical protein
MIGGFSLRVGLRPWPPALAVDWAPVSTADNAEALHVSDEAIDVEYFEGAYVNGVPMGYAPGGAR